MAERRRPRMRRSVPPGTAIDRKPVIGLVGGIGSGKSTVARAFAHLGAAVIDSDRLAHEMLNRPEVVDELRRWWGDAVVGEGGRVRRSAVAEIVFGHAAELTRLEGLLYPLLHEQRARIIQGHGLDPKVIAVVLDAPKLYEAGVDRECDAVVFVDAPRSVRLERVGQDRGWGEAEVDRREKMMLPLDKKRSMADYIVENHAGMAELRGQVERVLTAVVAAFSNE